MTVPTIADLTYQEKSLTAFRKDDTGTFVYIGKTSPEHYDDVNDPVWQIKRYDPTNTEGMQYADNERESNKIWSNRTSYF